MSRNFGIRSFFIDSSPPVQYPCPSILYVSRPLIHVSLPSFLYPSFPPCNPTLLVSWGPSILYPRLSFLYPGLPSLKIARLYLALSLSLSLILLLCPFTSTGITIINHLEPASKPGPYPPTTYLLSLVLTSMPMFPPPPLIIYIPM